MNQLIQIIRHPRKFDSFANLPMRFDAAEMLFNEFWDAMGHKDQLLVENILRFSGKYASI